MSKHCDFILTPIEGILQEVPIVLKNVEIGFDTYGLYEYVMQSVFLKMTGFQEQKMKCICWELATDDYEYRYERYKRDSLGECSNLDEKNTVWNDLSKHVEELDSKEKELSDEEKTQIIADTKLAIETFYTESRMEGWAQKEYFDYKNLIKFCTKDCLCSKSKKRELFYHCDNCNRKREPEAKGSLCQFGTLTEAYKKLFIHRNRCAHNTLSYQHNLPSLDTMSNKKYIFENYFLHFALLIMIDKMIICLFQKYQEKNNTDFML